MTRFKILKANPRRSLAALATVLVAVGITGASGASFTAQTANPSNTFTAGTLTMANSKNAAAIFTSSPNMRPGDTAAGTVDIKNSGTLSGAFKLSKGTLTNNHATILMSDQLNLVVNDCGTDLDCSTSDNVYTGTLTDMGADYRPRLLRLPRGASLRVHRDVRLRRRRHLPGQELDRPVRLGRLVVRIRTETH